MMVAGSALRVCPLGKPLVLWVKLPEGKSRFVDCVIIISYGGRRDSVRDFLSSGTLRAVQSMLEDWMERMKCIQNSFLECKMAGNQWKLIVATQKLNGQVGICGLPWSTKVNLTSHATD